MEQAKVDHDEKVQEIFKFIETAWFKTLISCGGLLPRDAWGVARNVMTDLLNLRGDIENAQVLCGAAQNPPSLQASNMVAARINFIISGKSYSVHVSSPVGPVLRAIVNDDSR